MASIMKKLFKNIWARWKKVAHVIGRFQTRVLTTIFYFVVISPVGLVMRAFGWDPLEVHRSKAKRDTNFRPIKQDEPNSESMRRQS